MKKLQLHAYLLLMLATVWSCAENDNMDPVGKWELRAPAITQPDASASLVLDEETPTNTVRFEWAPAISSKGYGVKYAFVLDSANNADFSSPILKIVSGNGGKDLFVTPSQRQIDQALSLAGHDAGSTINLRWGVIATSMSKTVEVVQPISITRFLTESAPLTLYISGPATEKGSDLSQAIKMKAFKDADGNPANKFELYTSLKAGETFKFYSQPGTQSLVYGGSNGQLVKGGSEITAPETARYSITADFNNNTYALLKIDKWSVVGGNISGGWGGDAPLQYKGNSIWEGTIDLTEPNGFVFRANGDWAYLLKRIKGTTNKLVMESQSASQGLEFEDIPSTGLGKHKFTLNLAADEYTYSIVEDNSVEQPAEVPATLFLLENGTQVAELVKSDNKFNTAGHLALQAGVNYTLNTAADGSGTSYNLGAVIGETEDPNANAVSGEVAIGAGAGNITVARDQAYILSFDFSNATLGWKYHNMKLFHWNDDGGWDSRDEFLMTYVHPYKYEVTAPLKAGYDQKFISPWDVDLGTDTPAALSGNLMREGSTNLKSIAEDASYKTTIVLAPDYATGTYQFVKQ